jgi:Na+/H+ antiporter NhaD/arsenite permease-like protein
MRALLRWSSLIGAAAVLATLGAARTHQHNFPLFLGVVLGVAIVTVVVFVATAGGDS